jgi:hypothetical protein
MLAIVCRCMYKTSTPGDRATIRKQLPVVLTSLEMKMPINWCTMVIHVLGFHSLDQFEEAGPYVVSNLLDIERYHTLYKSMARGTNNVMASINNHYALLEAAISARLEDDIAWTTAPTVSSVAGLSARMDSRDRADRFCRALGGATSSTLSDEAYQQVQTLWADAYPEYAAFHRRFNAARRRRVDGIYESISMWSTRETVGQDDSGSTGAYYLFTLADQTIFVFVFVCHTTFICVLLLDGIRSRVRACNLICVLQLHNRMEYAGATFRTWDSQKNLKHHDDAQLVLDYSPPGSDEIKRAYARIKRLFVHQAYPGGPSRCIVEGSWYDVVGTCLVSKTTLVRRNRANPFNTSSRFAFLDNCSERPVAVWPRDPFDQLPDGHREKKWFHVIDRNQSVLYA